MTNEQREAIENLSEIVNLSKEELQKENENITAILDYEDLKSLDTVLSLIKEQQEEIEGLKNKEVLIKRYFKKCDLIKQKDKQIDLMAEKLVQAHEWFYSEFDNFTKEDFIRYFERKVEDVK